MTTDKRAVGARGERLARRLLWRQGYRILHTNYRTCLGEIDIVATEGDTLVFVEVRTRTTTAMGTPEESVGQDKRKRLERLAAQYILEQRLRDPAYRLDMVSVMLPKDGKVEVKLLRNAF